MTAPHDAPPARRALVVRGGWAGHSPVESTDLFLPGLCADGFAVTIVNDLDVYRDAALLADTDLIVQCWSMGTLTGPQCAGLCAAVRAGTGFAGWHGGVVATFADSAEYLRMVGGLFLFHPEHFLDHRVVIEPDRAGHPIVAGLADFAITTEQYWMLTDAANTVLASTLVAPADGVDAATATPMPVVWTRRWGAGRVFVSTIGHRPADLTHPTVRTLTARGLRWAARAAAGSPASD